MKMVEFTTLLEALAFVESHGGPLKNVSAWEPKAEGYDPASGAFGDAGAAVLLVDGSFFVVEAYTNGPLSEVTPDEDFGVRLLGFIAEGG